ncbi:ABC transporter ATP-binding protein [Rosettibacter firmus]|uniref:ABC transporter ATP-binding protein n=1 Tax=Rosettibacter firmus TaxID=3111522 RepID=UPI00336C30C7
MNEEKIIEVRGLTKKFGKIVAVNNLDLNVYKGDVFGFLGPNGAGKSTTIRMLLSLIKPNSGTIKIFGLNLHTHKKEILKKVGAIVEKPDFYLYLTAYKNLEILGKLSGVEITKNKIMEMLDLVGLSERFNSKVKTFSHGMKQRLGIAQALLHDPELIILDEPTTGLDPQGMKEIRDLIVNLSKLKGKTIFLSSHILREVELIANRMIIINKGSAQVEGKVDELLKSGKVLVTFEVNNIDKALNVINSSNWVNHLKSIDKNSLTFEMLHNEISSLNKYLVDNSLEVSAVVPIRSLEDYFLKITEGNTK